MPAIIELRLRAERHFSPTTRQLHGLACALFEGFSYEGHNGPDKPFSVWPLTQVPGGWVLRAAWLSPGFPHSVLAACGQLRLGPVTYTVTDMALRPASHEELADGSPADRADLTFRSPVFFSHSGTSVVVPQPWLIAGSWCRRWNASLPADDDLAIGDDFWQEISHFIQLAAFDLRTEHRDNGNGRKPNGFTGKATLRLAKEAGEEVRQAFGVLARFAEFCGTGAQTTHGFGATSAVVIQAGRRSEQLARSTGNVKAAVARA